jgi:hypothetical protein
MLAKLCYGVLFLLALIVLHPRRFRGVSPNDAWAVAATLGYYFFGFLASRFPRRWPFAIAILL